jgi:hypothetical protein
MSTRRQYAAFLGGGPVLVAGGHCGGRWPLSRLTGAPLFQLSIGPREPRADFGQHPRFWQV